MTTTFDTLEYVKTLTNAGFTQEQAEAQARAMVNITDNTLATKQDIKDLKNELIIKLGGMLVVSVGVILAAIRFL